MPENSEIIRAVRKGLDSLNIRKATPTGRWTKAVKTELCRIGRNFDYEVYAGRYVKEDEKDGGEWLYDVTWLKYDRSGNDELTDAPLIVECEWGDYQDIEDDFEKLLLARARVRVMIFGGADEPGGSAKDIADKLARKEEAFKRFRGKGDWLLAAWEPNGDDWRFRYFTIGSGPSATEC